jgi:integrase/recombinase XerD
MRSLSPRRRRRRSADTPYGPAPCSPLCAVLDEYCQAALAEGSALETVRTQRRTVLRFIAWADARHLRALDSLDRRVLEEYQKHLHLRVKRDGRPLSIGSQVVSLAAIKAWLKWLVRQGRLRSNPAEWLRVPRLPSTLPATILGASRVQEIVSLADTGTALGIRDRAILETLYSSGIRRSELVGLGLADVDPAEWVVMVRRGKGRKDRLVPLGESASHWISRFLCESRPAFATAESGGALFVDEFGRPLTPRYLGDLVRRYLDQGGVSTRGSCHVFRHAMATHMLDNGADIRHIQAMLGHARLETTQIYTRVSIVKLKQVHAATHPTGRLRPKPEDIQA